MSKRSLSSLSRYAQRAPRAAVTAVLGPTNTGKTHLAVERMLAHDSGMIGLPLRLLAREIYDRVAKVRGTHSVALITGEEKILPKAPRYYVCTVEAMPLDIPVAFLCVDEVQLCADRERGHMFTDRLLHARGEEETMFLGADTVRPLMNRILPDMTFVSRPRFSELSFAGHKKLSRLPRRSAVVAFSAESVYAIAELIRRQRGGAAVVMGALSPRTRNAQVALYQSGEVDFLVATDAIGMGLNMDVDHVVFASLSKFDGTQARRLRPTETAQIAGRAGRYLSDGTFGTTADASQMGAELVEQIESHRFDPIAHAQWRNRALDFGSLGLLIRSLEAPAPNAALQRTRAAIDTLSLKALSQDPDIAKAAETPFGLHRLWEVCQIPDFRKVMLDEHIHLLQTIYGFVAREDEVIPEDWLAARINQLDRIDGDIDTLSNRIAHMRTWAFVSNRSAWLKDSAYWQERTRSAENKLSDALHARLTQRFVDRRTSILLKTLREQDRLSAEVNDKDEVIVEGEYVGRLNGLKFEVDPRAHGIHGKALRHAASHALGPEIRRRAAALAAAPADRFHLSEGGKVRWQDAPVANLVPGKHWLSPGIEVIGDFADAVQAEGVSARVSEWLRGHLGQTLKALYDIAEAGDGKSEDAVPARVRGLCFRLIESFGLLDRRDVQAEMRALSSQERKALRRLNIRAGAHSLFVPAMLKAHAANLALMLVKLGLKQPHAAAGALTNRSICVVEADSTIEPALYRAAGYCLRGGFAVRADMLERLSSLIYEEADRLNLTARLARVPDEDFAVAALIGLPAAQIAARVPPPRAKRFAITGEMQSLTGCGEDRLGRLLSALGFRRAGGAEEAEGNRLWLLPRPKAANKAKPSRTRRRDRREGSAKKAPASTKATASPPRRRDKKKRQRKDGTAPKSADSPFAVLATLNSVRKQ